MPLTTTKTQVLESTTYYRITGFEVELGMMVGVRNDDRESIDYSPGRLQVRYETTPGGRRKVHSVPLAVGLELLPADYRAETKAALYKLMRDAGVFPSGTVS
jgi:hypothetical protein|tara:strand:- start:337 stop:642 length:306 start_codon:yes stop_codon:yes gene_type:complete